MGSPLRDSRPAPDLHWVPVSRLLLSHSMGPESFKSRVVELRDVPPDQLTAHPMNFRRHPGSQRDAVRASIERFGMAAPVYATPDLTVIDGHLRVEEALTVGAPTVPVVIIDMDETEAADLLLRLDPTAALATVDRDVLQLLMAEQEWDPGEQALVASLDALLTDPELGPPDDENETGGGGGGGGGVTCPACGYVIGGDG